MVLRSDEVANQAEVERDQKFRGNVGKGFSAVASLGTAAAGGALASKVMPFLNQYIPAGLAMKGINKVSPQLGAFLQKGHEMGLDVEEGLDFIKGKLGGERKEPAKQDRNIIQQESPELHTFIDQEIRKGRKPIEAGALAQNDKRFSDVIKKLMKAHKTPWSSIIQSIYGTGDMAQSGQQRQAEQPAQPTQGSQGGPGQQALMGILAKINQKLGQ